METTEKQSHQFNQIAAEVRSDMKRAGIAPDNVWTIQEALTGFLEVLRRMEEDADE